jgi:hypothetical protein
MRQVIVLLVALMLTTGCTSARISKSLTSGVIGCPAKNIDIIDEKASASGTHEWIAECKGKRYVCSFIAGSNTNCKEMTQ